MTSTAVIFATRGAAGIPTRSGKQTYDLALSVSFQMQSQSVLLDFQRATRAHTVYLKLTDSQFRPQLIHEDAAYLWSKINAAIRVELLTF